MDVGREAEVEYEVLVVLTLNADEPEARFENEGKLEMKLLSLAAEWVDDARLEGRSPAYGWEIVRDVLAWPVGTDGGGPLGGVSLRGRMLPCFDHRFTELRFVLELDLSTLRACSAEARVETDCIDGARGLCSGVPKENPARVGLDGASGSTF